MILVKCLFCSYLWVHSRAYICESTVLENKWNKSNEKWPVHSYPLWHTLPWRLGIALTSSSSQQWELSHQNICGGEVQSSQEHQGKDKWTMDFIHSILDTFELSTVATSCVALNQGLYKQAVICFCFFQSKMTETFVYMKCFEEVGGCYSLLFGSSVHHKEASLLLKPGLSWGKSPLGLWIFSLSSHIAAVSSRGYWLHWC